MALNLLWRSPGRLFWLGGIASIVLSLAAGTQFRDAEAEEYYFSTGGCTNAYAGSYYDGFQLVSTTVKPSSGTCTYIYQLADFDTYPSHAHVWLGPGWTTASSSLRGYYAAYSVTGYHNACETGAPSCPYSYQQTTWAYNPDV